jgi:hypothetical protein
MAFPVHAGRAADQAPQPRADQPQNHGQDETYVMVTRHHGTSQQAYDEPEDGVSDHR